MSYTPTPDSTKLMNTTRLEKKSRDWVLRVAGPKGTSKEDWMRPITIRVEGPTGVHVIEWEWVGVSLSRNYRDRLQD